MPKQLNAGLLPLDDSGVADRLRQAVKDAGGNLAVAKASEVPLSTLNDYLKGNDVKFSRMVDLANACKVSLDWLASGHENSTLPDFALLQRDMLSSPAHFWGLLISIRACREYHEKEQLVPSLADVLNWIGPGYIMARALPDLPVEFLPPKTGSTT